jgi:ABC-type dipeptide/oligopeptide/nickel transport system permease component
MVLADMVAGSIIVEQVFNIPGLGRILLTSISNRDYPVVQMIILPSCSDDYKSDNLVM